ncbi:N-acetylneuraminate synthase family protein [Synergistaceae bacterium OttesenSCG-928-I11]|nr:N-acetylneuraminate synthase family protein [Synergistaceae bacterium OttesenSCG-928-I11]
MKIGDIQIGADSVPLVIPEMGINHGGSLSVAVQMVDAIAGVGGKIVKHQTHIVQDEMTHLAKEVVPGNSEKSIYDVMAECALSEGEELELKKYAESKGLIYLSTPFSRAAADRLEKFGVHAYKIGSGEMNNYPLIEYIAAFGKPMIVSTGMNDIESIEKVVMILERNKIDFVLLHTTNLYPTKPEQVRLGAMMEMARHFEGVPFGLSDHTLNNNACIAAMALGASVVERHFTDRKDRIGNDISCSMAPNDLRELLTAAEEVFMMRGGEKKPLKEEQVTIDFAFATVVSIREIEAGEPFSKDNIWVKRPGIGEIRAEYYDGLLGKRALCKIPVDTHIERKMIDEAAGN